MARVVLMNNGGHDRLRPSERGATDGERPIRQELIARLRAQIAAGTYDTPERLTIAVERMLDCYIWSGHDWLTADEPPLG